MFSQQILLLLPGNSLKHIHATVLQELKMIGKISVVAEQVLHRLATENLQQCVVCCESLLK